MSVLYHGGAPDLQPGDSIEPGHSRDNYDDCPICRARREKGADAIEGTGHPEQVYCTRYRDYADLNGVDVRQGRRVPGAPSRRTRSLRRGLRRLLPVRPAGDRQSRRKTRHPHVETPSQGHTPHATPGRRPLHQPTATHATPQMVEKFIQRSAADTMHIMRQAERSIR